MRGRARVSHFKMEITVLPLIPWHRSEEKARNFLGQQRLGGRRSPLRGPGRAHLSPSIVARPNIRPRGPRTETRRLPPPPSPPPPCLCLLAEESRSVAPRPANSKHTTRNGSISAYVYLRVVSPRPTGFYRRDYYIAS